MSSNSSLCVELFKCIRETVTYNSSFMENLKNHYDAFPTCRQAVNICKISRTFSYHGIFIIKHILKIYSAILFTLSGFSIFTKVEFWKKKSCKVDSQQC